MKMPLLRWHFYAKSLILHWLGREDSNLRMAESKSAALPLGYAPIMPFTGCRRPRRYHNARRNASQQLTWIA